MRGNSLFFTGDATLFERVFVMSSRSSVCLWRWAIVVIVNLRLFENICTHSRDRVVALCNQRPGPALGMFEVFGRTGPQNLGGAAISDLTKVNLPVWRTMDDVYKLQADTRFDLSLDWLSFCHSFRIRKYHDIFENIKISKISKISWYFRYISDIFDIFKILPLYNFK